MAKLKITVKRVEDLKVYENNPRKNKKAVAAVAESIKKFGFTNPIIINDMNVILAGHTRLQALKELGVEKVDCIQLTNLSEQEQKAFRIADNRVADFSVWNDKMLQEEMRDISAEDWEKFGFNEKLLEKVKAPEMTTCPKCGRQFIKI